MKSKQLAKGIGIMVALLSLATGTFLLLYPPDPLVYCQKVIDSAFEQWMSVNKTEIRPNVNGNGKDSLALIGVYMLGRYTEGVLRDYGYVPGLRNDDPKNLVMMYLKEKTRRHWNGDHSASILREPKWMVIGPGFWDVAGQEEGCYEGGRLQTTA